MDSIPCIATVIPFEAKQSPLSKKDYEALRTQRNNVWFLFFFLVSLHETVEMVSALFFIFFLTTAFHIMILECLYFLYKVSLILLFVVSFAMILCFYVGITLICFSRWSLASYP